MAINFIKKYHLHIIFYLIIYLFSIVSVWGLNHTLWVDETHFYKTILLFTNDLSINTLKVYDEIVTPFTFIIYSIWARVFNSNIETLRILSLLIAFITYFRFYLLALKFVSSTRAVVLLLIFSLNPYMLGVSFFCYTDMLTILFSIEIVHAIKSNVMWRLILFSTLALYTRQYNITILMSVGLYFLITKDENNRFQWFKGLLMFIPILLFLPLMILWKGIAPVSEMHKLLDGYKYVYQIAGLETYLVSIIIYSVPFSIIWLYRNYNLKMIELIIISSVIIVMYNLFPIKAAQCSIDQGVYTVGLFHKIINKVFINQFLIHSIFIICTIIAVTCIYQLIGNFKNYKLNGVNTLFLINIIMFLILIPFSFQIWEKYILNILPYILILFAQNYNSSFNNGELNTNLD